MSILAKLKFKSASKLLILNLPDSVEMDINDINVKTSLPGKESFEQALVFAKDGKALGAVAGKLVASLAQHAIFWIAYPKKSGSIKTDITRDNGWAILNDAGYDVVTSVSIDNDWSALRFRKTEEIGTKLRDIPMNERNVEGVDFINRTAELPKDAIAAMKPYPGLKDFFDSMSFTHKKEYVEAIVAAKKPETRQRRIEKMIEMVQQLKTDKESKKR